MKCPKCGSEIKEGASFCSACGTPLEKISANNEVKTNKANVQNQNKTPWGLIIGVIIIAIAIIVVFAGISMSNEENNDTKNNDTTENKNQSTQDNTKDSETVTYDDYSFTVPGDYNATSTSSQLLITNNDGTLAEAVIYQSGTSYDTLAQMKNSIVSLLESQETSQSQNYDFTNAITEEKTYGGKSFLVTSGIKQGSIDLDISYSDAENGVFIISIAKTSGNISSQERDALYSIVASAKK